MDVDHRKTPGACNPRPSDKEEEDKLDRVTADLADGFYKIYQEIENDMTIASLIWPDMQLRPNDSFFINMVPTETRAAPNSDFYFKLTRQHGVKNGFTIVPASSRIPESVPASGTTTFIDVKKYGFRPEIVQVPCLVNTVLSKHHNQRSQGREQDHHNKSFPNPET
ncbi:hypothetical protein BYT27DRAFT_6806975 [Phlegmacium glaucopus]|nr:hypothetical protein BYT27DRAFT_6806975 [Phlegmacium glaucopus]